MVANGIGAAQQVRKPFARSSDEGLRVSAKAIAVDRVYLPDTAGGSLTGPGRTLVRSRAWPRACIPLVKMINVGVPMTALPAPLVRLFPPPLPFLRSLNTRFVKQVTRNIVERFYD